MSLLNGLIGIIVILGIAYSVSSKRDKINWKTVQLGLLMQLLLVVILLVDTTSWFGFNLFLPFKAIMNFISKFFVTVISFTMDGAKLIFGPLADQEQMLTVFPNSGGFVFAFMALTTIIFFGSLMAVLYHLRIMQFIIQIIAKLMVKVLGISGSEAISVAANVFIGQTEAPLVIKPYVEKMTKSELLTLMTGGMATIAGGVMAVYVGILGGPDEAQQIAVASRLLTASFMAAPATIVIAKIMLPETEESLTYGTVKMDVEKNASNVVEAAANGASDGMHLALNVAAMLLAFTGIIYMLNAGSSWLFTDMLGLTIDGKAIDLSVLVGYVFSIVAFVIGVASQDAVAFGTMLGQKLILNEFFAYFTLSQIQGSLQAKTVFLSTFAFCGFANFSSIAIQIGGIGGIAPSRRSDIAKFGFRAVLGGTLATLMTASIAGIFFAL